MRTPRPASIRCSLVTSAQPRRQLRSCWVVFQLRFFGAEAFGGEVSGGQEYVAVGVVGIVAVDTDVRDHAFGDELSFDEVAE